MIKKFLILSQLPVTLAEVSRENYEDDLVVSYYKLKPF